MAANRIQRLITLPIEHKAVLDVAESMEKEKFPVQYGAVDSTGMIENAEQLLSDIGVNDLLEVMLVNNETGVVHDLQQIKQSIDGSDAILMSDATQAIGKIVVHPKELGIQLMPFSAHKIYGPKGVGALFIDQDLQKQMAPLIHGGRHERGLRSGTLNVPGIVGLSEALSLAMNEMADYNAKMSELRDALESTLIQELTGVAVNGSVEQRVSNTSNLYFEGVHSEDLLLSLGARVALSSGSACTSASVEPSHVIKAMGYSEERAFSSIRFSFGRFNSMADVEQTVPMVVEAVNRLRNK